MGIEPTFEAWEAPVLPLNYTRINDLQRSKFFYTVFTPFLHFFECKNWFRKHLSATILHHIDGTETR